MGSQGHPVQGGALVIAALLYPVLLLRWRWPVALLLYESAAQAVVMLLTDYSAITGGMLVVHAVARTQHHRVAWAGLLITMSSLAARYVSITDVDSSGTAITLMLYVGAFLFGRSSREAEHRARAREEYLALVAEQDSAARLQAERLRLARDLHDIVSHSVSGMLLQAAGARAVLMTAPQSEETRRIADSLSAIEKTGVQAMRELHRLLGLLREEVGSSDDLEGSSLEYLDSLVSTAQLGGLEINMRVDGSPEPLDASVDLAAYRVVQEALANAMKHAGPGARVDLRLGWQPDDLEISALCVPARHGVATPTAAQGLGSGYGLRGLTERLALLGGSLEYGPVETGGYMTRARIPLGSVPEGRGSPQKAPADPTMHAAGVIGSA
ncbi:MAG: sensor histidine kinase [Actinomycetales bacterium]